MCIDKIKTNIPAEYKLAEGMTTQHHEDLTCTKGDHYSQLLGFLPTALRGRRVRKSSKRRKWINKQSNEK